MRTKIDDMENLFKAHYMKMYRLDILILRDENVLKDIVSRCLRNLFVSGEISNFVNSTI